MIAIALAPAEVAPGFTPAAFKRFTDAYMAAYRQDHPQISLRQYQAERQGLQQAWTNALRIIQSMNESGIRLCKLLYLFTERSRSVDVEALQLMPYEGEYLVGPAWLSCLEDLAVLRAVLASTDPDDTIAISCKDSETAQAIIDIISDFYCCERGFATEMTFLRSEVGVDERVSTALLLNAEDQPMLCFYASTAETGKVQVSVTAFTASMLIDIE